MTTSNTQTAFQRARTAIEAAKTGYAKHLEGNKATLSADRQRLSNIRGEVGPDAAALTNMEFGVRNRAFANSDAFRTMIKAVDDVRARHEQARTRLTKVRNELSPDGDTAAELRATRYWNRTKGILDSCSGPNGNHSARLRIEKAIASATPHELGTLLQEVEGYCESRKLSTADWLDHALEKAAPDYMRAKRDVHRSSQALTLIESTASRIKTAVESGHNAPMIISLPDNYDPDGD